MPRQRRLDPTTPVRVSEPAPALVGTLKKSIMQLKQADIQAYDCDGFGFCVGKDYIQKWVTFFKEIKFPYTLGDDMIEVKLSNSWKGLIHLLASFWVYHESIGKVIKALLTYDETGRHQLLGHFMIDYDYGLIKQSEIRGKTVEQLTVPEKQIFITSDNSDTAMYHMLKNTARFLEIIPEKSTVTLISLKDTVPRYKVKPVNEEEIISAILNSPDKSNKTVLIEWLSMKQ